MQKNYTLAWGVQTPEGKAPCFQTFDTRKEARNSLYLPWPEAQRRGYRVRKVTIAWDWKKKD